MYDNIVFLILILTTYYLYSIRKNNMKYNIMNMNKMMMMMMTTMKQKKKKKEEKRRKKKKKKKQNSKSYF